MIDKSDLGEEEKRVCLQELEEQGQDSSAVGRLLQVVEVVKPSVRAGSSSSRGDLVLPGGWML